uniref:HHIP-like protein 2 isoform X2 n=1 Tax=Crassostrea virginica TaxID=6565 RepID=A0A8B8DYN7_CRAVI|nr:HHIP-like protein 2 isoform X2 [Crassostrea virginica]
MGFHNFFMKTIVIFMAHVAILEAHPQCLDFRPPFNPENPLQFCTEYSSFGCCTNQDDLDARDEYNRIMRQLSDVDMFACEKYVKELVCQKCSPYAAHIYDAEGTLMSRPFPGLCNNYCRDFYRQCRNIVSYFTQDPNIQQHVSYGTSAFCEYVRLSDNDYCYPELKTNPILNNRISIKQYTSEGCLCMEPFADVLYNPVFARHSGDGSNRLFIGEVSGLIFVYYLNGSSESQPFLDISYQTLNTRNEGDERGLLGLAFHPNFRQNGRFFVYYSTPLEQHDDFMSNNHKIRISEFLVSHLNPNVADVESERVILEVVQPFWNHNGGEILFGDDGYLYIFVGDGGSRGDPHRNAQNITSLLGKVLRIDVDTELGYPYPYKIPPDNPFVDDPMFRPEIYAYGIRNIWRCGKDKGDPVTGEGKGRIVCGDVGQSAYEELDLIVKGGNYGWNSREGPACYDKEICGLVGPEIPPIHYYPHKVGKSVTGGHFYRGCLSPNLNGFYIYGDFMNGKLFRLLYDRQLNSWNNKELNMCGPEMCTAPLINYYEPHILSFGEDEGGEVYMLSTGRASSSDSSGKVYRIVDPARRGNPAQCDMARLRVPPPTTGVPTMTPPLYNVWTTTPSAVRENGGSSTAAPTGTSPGGRVGRFDWLLSKVKNFLFLAFYNRG